MERVKELWEQVNGLPRLTPTAPGEKARQTAPVGLEQPSAGFMSCCQGRRS